QHLDAERPPLRGGLLHPRGQRLRHCLGVARAGETTHGDGHARLDEFGGLLGRQQTLGKAGVADAFVHCRGPARGLRLYPVPSRRASQCGNAPFRFPATPVRADQALRAAIQRSILASSTSSGTEPSLRTSAWNSRTSKPSPSSASARRRSSWIFSSPIL